MGVGLCRLLGLGVGAIGAPGLRIAQEEVLRRRVAGCILAAFSRRRSEKRPIGKPDAAIVGYVLAQRELAVDMNIPCLVGRIVHRDEGVIFTNEASGALFEGLSVRFRPPIFEIAMAVIMPALIVEAMG